MIDTSDRLSITVLFALVLHAAVIFGVNFNLNRQINSTPTLDITLAHFRSPTEPKEADFVAQYGQEGSGSEEVAKELRTDRLAEIADFTVQEVNPMPQTRAVEPSDKSRRIIVGQRADRRLEASRQSLSEEQVSREGGEFDLPEINAEIASLKAKLDRQRQEYAKRPRIRRLTSVSTKASYDAEYLHSWSEKVERIGNANYPKEALRNYVFGALRLAAVILPNGTIEKVEILQSSGHRILDDAARQIVHLASPFAPFPPEIRRQADQLEIIRTWHFEITGITTTH